MVDISPGQVKKIKTMQRAVGLSDAAYREMLRGQAGVESCKDLKGPKIQIVIRHLESCLGGVSSEQGAVNSEQKIHRLEAGATVPGPLWATAWQLKEIRRLWGRVSRVAAEWGPESRQAHKALNKFLWRRFKVTALEWLTLTQAQRVIEGLKAMAGRRPANRGKLNEMG